MPESRRAVGFTPMETRREVVVELAQIADRLGYEFLVLPEAWGHDSTILLTEIAIATERIRLMSGILSIWGRTPGTIAMNTASLLDVSGGRYVLGLGVSTPELAEGFHDVTYDRPANKLGHVTREVRGLLNGERANLSPDARAGVRPLRLGQKVEHPSVIAIAAMGPLTKRIAAEQADFWIPVYVTLGQLRTQIEDLKSIRQDAGVTRDSLQTLAGPTLAVGDDLDVARGRAADMIAWYIVAMGGNYSRLLTEQGLGKEVQAVIDANPTLKPGACVIPREAEVLLDELAVIATLDGTNDALAPWDDATDVTMVGLPAGIPRSSLIELVEAAAPR